MLENRTTPLSFKEGVAQAPKNHSSYYSSQVSSFQSILQSSQSDMKGWHLGCLPGSGCWALEAALPPLHHTAPLGLAELETSGQLWQGAAVCMDTEMKYCVASIYIK